MIMYYSVFRAVFYDVDQLWPNFDTTVDFSAAVRIEKLYQSYKFQISRPVNFFL